MEQTFSVATAATTSSGYGAASGAAPAVLLRDLHKSFGAVQALLGIDLRIEPGEVVAFLGRTEPARPRPSTCCSA